MFLHKSLIRFFPNLHFFGTGEPKKCEYKRYGDSIIVNLKYSGQKREIIWRKDGKVIFEKKKEEIRTGVNTDITSDGSLELKGLTASNDGTYEGEAFDQNGVSHPSETKTICVIGKLAFSSHFTSMLLVGSEARFFIALYF